MRAVMTVLTPGVSFDLDRLQFLLTPTGWLLTAPEPQWQQTTLTTLLRQLPADVQAQLRDAERLLIQVDRSTWGIVSLERKQCVLVRLIQPDGDLASMKRAAEAVAQRLPTALGGSRDGVGSKDGALSTDGAGSIDLTDTIWIRSNNTGETLAQGSVVSHRTLRFGAYLAQERRREARWLRYAVLLTVLFAAAGISIHLLGWTGAGAVQAQGYLERIASGLFVASLTLLVNLQFEYSDWRSPAAGVHWVFG